MANASDAPGAVARLAAPERLISLYLRLLALAHLSVGILYWLEILSLPSMPQGALLTLTFAERAEAIAYAVLDPIAAVGLWLTTSWGVVVWMILAVSRMIIVSGLVGENDPDLVELAVHAASIAAYLVLWRMARAAAARREQLG